MIHIHNSKTRLNNNHNFPIKKKSYFQFYLYKNIPVSNRSFIRYKNNPSLRVHQYRNIYNAPLSFSSRNVQFYFQHPMIHTHRPL